MFDLCKSNCTGCGACYSICPTGCISMEPDDEGFLYPIIADEKKCTKCHKCEGRCPAIAQGPIRKPLNVYAAKNTNEEIRLQSSSGGMFSLFAEHIVQEGGIVFGARFNSAWEVIHGYAETIEDLLPFRGSKYAQSITGDTYKQVEYFLKNGKKVLYSGTPCQIAGLKTYLRKDYDSLLTIDVVCHGVPSPLVWKKYLNEIMDETTVALKNVNENIIADINFRDKVKGWYIFTFVISFIFDKISPEKEKMTNNFFISDDKKMLLFMENAKKNSYMKGFLRDLYLRPSCYKCHARSLKSGSDITLADYWGIRNVLPEFDDDKGVSMVMVNTEKGKQIYELLSKDDIETTYKDALAGNYAIEKSPFPHSRRKKFFKEWNHKPIIYLSNKLATFPLRTFSMAMCFVLPRKLRILRKLGLLSFIKKEFKR